MELKSVLLCAVLSGLLSQVSCRCDNSPEFECHDKKTYACPNGYLDGQAGCDGADQKCCRTLAGIILEQHRADLLDDRKFPCVESNLGTCMHYKNHCVTGWVGDGTPALITQCANGEHRYCCKKGDQVPQEPEEYLRGLPEAEEK